MTPEARRILAEAKGLVAHGWFQLSGRRAGGFPGHCVATAFVTACETNARGVCEAVDALVRITGTNDFPRWNDAPERTHEEVVALFDKALLEDSGEPMVSGEIPEPALLRAPHETGSPEPLAEAVA